MSSTINRIQLEVDAKSKGVKELNAEISTLEKKILDIQRDSAKNVDLFNAKHSLKNAKLLKENLITTQKQTNLQKGLVGWIRKGQDAQIGFNGAALSTLFFGMAIKKAFGGALKSIFEGYKKIIPESSTFNVMTTRLSANWEFFKFQLADALTNSTLFQRFIGFTINLVKWLQHLSPTTKKWIVVLLEVGAALGLILVLSATIKLGLGGISDTIGLLKTTTAAFSWGNLLKFGGLILVAAALALVAGSIIFATSKSKTMKTKWDELGTSLLKVIDNVLIPFNIHFESFGEIMIWISGITQMFLSGLLELGNALIGVANIFLVALGGALIWIGGVLTDVAEAAVEMWNAIKGKGFHFSGFDKASLAAHALTNTLNTVIDTFAKTQNDINKSTITFDEISTSVDEYKKSLLDATDAQQQLKNASGNISTTLKNNVSPDILKNIQIPSNIGTNKTLETTNNVTINVDGGTLNGTMVGDKVNKFIQDFSESTGISNPVKTSNT